MIDHIGLVVSDFTKSKSFFERALAPLGYGVLMEFSGAAGFGMAGKPDFWITQGQAPPKVHVAFTASQRAIQSTSAIPSVSVRQLIATWTIVRLTLMGTKRAAFARPVVQAHHQIALASRVASPHQVLARTLVLRSGTWVSKRLE